MSVRRSFAGLKWHFNVAH